MTQSENALTAQFESILDAIRGTAPIVDLAQADAETAIEQFQSVLSDTILPRRISLRSDDGNSLSVVVKNRRIIAVADVHPASLWTGDDAPQETECVAEFHTFGNPLATTLLALTENDGCEITQHFLTDPLPDTISTGYPASKLFEHFVFAQRGGNSPAVTEFFDAFPDNARARFGADLSIDVPDESRLDDKWMSERVAEYRDSVGHADTDMRLVRRDGEQPIAMAYAMVGGDGCLVVSEDLDQFDDLQERLSALQTSQQQ